ncbi:prokineticin-1 [Poeciliopsis prolifica]|uniref:prokineticin-1 n=1 Tax=Poeciliopsis prolifica TaxID=188132 RepID=UPI002413A9A0|nr:prokineticin-1 [Poeciliopsis prolifica]
MDIRAVFLSFLLVTVNLSRGSVAPLTCEKDEQCGHLECCAISLWKSNQRMCISQGGEGDECHPLSFKVPYSGMRQEHICPCLPQLMCKFSYNLFKCVEDLKK